jgi:hypothetical protein
MNKKIIGILIIMLLIGTVLPVAGTYINIKNHFVESDQENNKIFLDILDQQQPIQTGNTFIIGDLFHAQSFVPTKNVLTRVELFIYKEGLMNNDFVVSIRDNLIGNDLTSASMPANQIPPDIQSQKWVEFDFPNIIVTPGLTYYIVCTTQGGNLDNCYVLGIANNNPYPQGDAWEYGIFNGYIWQKMEDIYGKPYDLCFRTYVARSKIKNNNHLLLKIFEQYYSMFPILSKQF